MNLRGGLNFHDEHFDVDENKNIILKDGGNEGRCEAKPITGLILERSFGGLITGGYIQFSDDTKVNATFVDA